MMTLRRLKAIAALFLLFLFGIVAAAAPSFPELSGRVVDNAGLLSAAQEERLTLLLAEHEKKTTNQVVVVTLKDLQGYDIADYGYQLGRHWGIGRAGKDNGVLLIVAPNERKVRIEVGYGLEGVLTDKLSHDIIQEVILPHFRKGNYAAGILKGTEAILSVLEGTHTAPKKADGGSSLSFDFSGIFQFVIFIIIAIANVFGGISSKLRFIFASVLGVAAGVVAWLLVKSIIFGLIIAFVVFVIMASRGLGGYVGKRSVGSWGGGGFGGGGGSFGGGGASGRW